MTVDAGFWSPDKQEDVYSTLHRRRQLSDEQCGRCPTVYSQVRTSYAGHKVNKLLINLTATIDLSNPSDCLRRLWTAHCVSVLLSFVTVLVSISCGKLNVIIASRSPMPAYAVFPKVLGPLLSSRTPLLSVPLALLNH